MSNYEENVIELAELDNFSTNPEFVTFLRFINT